MRILCKGLAAFFLALTAVLILLFFGAGWFVSTPSAQPDQSDLIVALGGDQGTRVSEVLNLFSRGYAPRILLTGVDAGHPKTRPAYLEWRETYLVEKGVPRSALVFDLQSANTWEEAQNTLALMQKENWRRVMVVSDPPHMRRLSWVWRRVFEGSGKEFLLIAASNDNWNPGRWWSNEITGQFVLMELIKLAYYWVKH